MALVINRSYLKGLQTNPEHFYTEINLNDRKIYLIENETFDLFVNVTKLTLANNLLISIDSRVFSQLADLELLDLSKNKIKSVDANALSGLRRLVNLDLNGNQLDSLRFLKSQQLANLEQLNLNENQIAKIDAINCFRNLNGLTRLNLASNGIASIELNAFNGLTSLREFDLSNNKLASVKTGMLSGLSNLTKLNLSNNKIAKIGSHALEATAKLTYLDLSNNQLGSLVDPTQAKNDSLIDKIKRTITNEPPQSNALNAVDVRVFKHVGDLTHLKLNNNQIESVCARAFQLMPKLNKLDLGDNRIDSLNVSAFDGLDDLTELWLNSNRLVSIDPNTFADLANNIRLVSLYQNQTKFYSFCEENLFNKYEHLYSFNQVYDLVGRSYLCFDFKDFLHHLGLTECPNCEQKIKSSEYEQHSKECLENLNKPLVCLICGKQLKKGSRVYNKCGHIVCMQCFTDTVSKDSHNGALSKCPVCHKNYSKENVIKLI